MEEIIRLKDYQKTKTRYNNSFEYRQKLYILIGSPCAGKTTYANNYLKNSNTIIVSTDEIRKEITGSYIYNKNNNDLVFDIAISNIKGLLVLGFNVVFDATNTNKKYRKKFIKLFQNNNIDIIGIIFNTPLSLCLERNSKRDKERKISENIMINISGFNEKNINEQEGFSEILYVNYAEE